MRDSVPTATSWVYWSSSRLDENGDGHVGWEANLTTDSRFGDALCVELAEGDEHRATLRRDSSRSLVLEVFESKSRLEIPAKWLRDVLDKADHELP